MMMQTADQVALWNPAGVKIHNLYAVHRTRLAEQIKTGEVTLPEMEEYVQLLADFLERLPPHIVIERISGDAPPRDLIAPQWVLDKGSIKKRLIEVLEQRDSYQGAKYDAASPAATEARPTSIPL
jgi:radical SAM superfamily enzyme